MGGYLSSTVNLAEKESKVLNPRLIGFDEHGNLRYGGPERDRNDEICKILATDKSHHDEPDKLWYIMDSTWVNTWLLYVHLDVDHAPAPGPCRNDRLLQNPTVEGARPRPIPNLIMATAKRAGDYRRVTEETWRAFRQLYPGSGPEICGRFPTIVPTTVETMKLHNVSEGDVVGAELGMSDNGWYDTSDWIVKTAESSKKVQPTGVVSDISVAFNKAGKNVDRFFHDLGGAIGVNQSSKIVSSPLGDIGVGAPPPPNVVKQTSPSVRDSIPTQETGLPQAGTKPAVPAKSPTPAATVASPTPVPKSSSPRSNTNLVLETVVVPAPMRASNKVVNVRRNDRRNDQFYDEMFFSSPDDEPLEVEMSGVYSDKTEITAGENRMLNTKA